MKTGNAPLLLRPSGKDYLWGGNRLNDEFEKRLGNAPRIPMDPAILWAENMTGWGLPRY